MLCGSPVAWNEGALPPACSSPPPPRLHIPESHSGGGSFSMQRDLPPKSRPTTKKASCKTIPKTRLPITPPDCIVEYVPQVELQLKWQVEKAFAEVRRNNAGKTNFRRIYASLMAPGGMEGWAPHPGITLRPPEPASPSDWG